MTVQEAAARADAEPGRARAVAGWTALAVVAPVSLVLLCWSTWWYGAALVSGDVSGAGSVVVLLVLISLPWAAALLLLRATRGAPLVAERLLLSLSVGGALALLVALPTLVFLPSYLGSLLGR